MTKSLIELAIIITSDLNKTIETTYEEEGDCYNIIMITTNNVVELYLYKSGSSVGTHVQLDRDIMSIFGKWVSFQIILHYIHELKTTYVNEGE